MAAWFDTEQQFQIAISRMAMNTAGGIILDILAMLDAPDEWKQQISPDQLERNTQAQLSSLRWICSDPEGERIKRWQEMFREDPRDEQAMGEVWDHVRQCIDNYFKGNHPVR